MAIIINQSEREFKTQTFYNMNIGQCFGTNYNKCIRNVMIKVSETHFLDICCGNNSESIEICDATFNITTKFVLYSIDNLDICVKKINCENI